MSFRTIVTPAGDIDMHTMAVTDFIPSEYVVGDSPEAVMAELRERHVRALVEAMINQGLPRQAAEYSMERQGWLVHTEFIGGKRRESK